MQPNVTPSSESLATAQRIEAGAFLDSVRGWDIYERAIISRDGNLFIGGSETAHLVKAATLS